MRVTLLMFYLFIGLRSSAQLFTEVSRDVGITFEYEGLDGQEVGAGVTVLDVNNDGWDDIFQAGGIFPSKLWLNNKGVFIDVTEKFGVNLIDTLFVQGAYAGDFDNDGYEDLFIANMAIPAHRGDNSPPILLKNVKGKRFVPVLQESFSELGHYPGASWGDINNDGYIDLFVINYVKEMENGFDSLGKPNTYLPQCLPNQLFLNDRGESFKNIAAEMKLTDEGCGLAACFTDFDNDNDVDLILLNDFGQFNHLGNRIYRNDYPELSFTDVSNKLGFYDEFYGMGVGPGDINNDGVLDYYLTNIGRNRIFINSIDTMTEIARFLGIDLTYSIDPVIGTSWTGIFFDVDNDCDQDLYVAKGYLESLENNAIKDENALFLNDAAGQFTDASESAGLNDSLIHRGAAFLDFDHDGDLDIVSGVIKSRRSEFAKTDQKIKLYRNNLENENNWIGFKLVGSGNVNRSCIGCSITISDQSGGLQIKEVDGGSGHSSQSTKFLYFGLGKSSLAENIIIQWLGNGEMKIDSLPAGHVYEVNRKGKTKILY